MHKIRREKRTTMSEVIVRGKRDKQNRNISISLLKARVSYLTVLKRENLSLPLKHETDQIVIWLGLPECLSVKIAFYPRTVERIVTAEFPFPLFFSSSAPFKL